MNTVKFAFEMMCSFVAIAALVVVGFCGAIMMLIFEIAVRAAPIFVGAIAAIVIWQAILKPFFE